jgi:type IV secretory pathway VirB2 component (pilin)
MRIKREYFVFFGLALFVFLVPFHAHAAATGGAFPWDNILTQLQAEVTGPIAFMVALFAIIGAGASLIMGRGEIGGFITTLLYVVLVAALIIEASNLLQMIGGTGALV